MLFTEANLKNIKLSQNINNFYDTIKKKRYHYHYACLVCGYPFLGNKNSEYCNTNCMNKSEKYKQNKSKSLTGKKRTEESKELMKINHADFSGDKHPNYKDGVKKKNIPLYNTYAHQLEPYEQCRRNINDPNILEVKCAYCGTWHIPKQSNVRNRINGINRGIYRLYCSNKCKQNCPIYRKIKYMEGYQPNNIRPLQKDWAALVLEQNNNEYVCEICGAPGNIAHHIDPVACNPIESADIDNGIILCKECHNYVHQLPGCTISELRSFIISNTNTYWKNWHTIP
jgi:hypothetical protein